MERKTIWKFPFQLNDEVIINMPEGAKVLTVDMHNDTPTLWAIVNPSARKVHRRFQLRGTGHPLRTVGDFIGTFQMDGGALVFHLFEDANG